MWAIIIDVIPNSKWNNVYTLNREIPKTISGITIGIYIRLLIKFFPLKSYLFKPTADIVPRIVDITVLVTAIIIVFLKASIKVAFDSNSLYHLKVNPKNHPLNQQLFLQLEKKELNLLEHIG